VQRGSNTSSVWLPNTLDALNLSPSNTLLNFKARTKQLKRKYTESYPEHKSQVKTPVRNKILEFIREKGNVSKDELSASIWKKMGIPEERIAYLDESNNWNRKMKVTSKVV
jgi:hypothetical protein